MEQDIPTARRQWDDLEATISRCAEDAKALIAGLAFDAFDTIDRIGDYVDAPRKTTPLNWHPQQ